MAPLFKLFWPDVFAAQAVVVILILLTIAAVVHVVQAFELLNIESRLLRGIDEKLQHTAFPLSVPNPHSALTGYLDDLNAGENSVVRRRIEGLAVPNVDRAALDFTLSEASETALERKVHYPRFLAGMCVFIGLLGTIVGLGLAVASIAGDSNNLETLQRDLKAALNGVGTGFSCTFYGVLCSVGLGALISVYQQRCTDFLSRLNQVVAARTLPFVARSEAEASADLADALKAAGDELAAKLAPFTQSLMVGGDSINQAAATMAVASATMERATPALDHFQRSLGEIVPALGKYLPEIAQHEADSREQVLQLSQTLSDLGQRLGEMAVRLDGALPRVAERENSVRTALEALGNRFEAFAERIYERERQILEERNQQMDRLLAAESELKAAVKLMERSVQENPALVKAGEIADLLKSTSGQLEKSGAAVSEEGKNVIGSIRNLSERFESFRTQIAEHLKGEAAARTTQVAELNEAFQALKLMVDLVEGALQDTPVVQREVQKLANDGAGTLHSLQSAATTLQEAARGLNTVSTQIERQSASLEKIAEGVRRVPAVRTLPPGPGTGGPGPSPSVPPPTPPFWKSLQFWKKNRR